MKSFNNFHLVIQGTIETTENNQIPNILSPEVSSLTEEKSADELLLLDLDPLASSNNDSILDVDDKLELLKFKIQELYASNTLNDQPTTITSSTLPDVISQPEDIPTFTLPMAVEQLEIEVRQEILQHTLETNVSGGLLPDLTTISNGIHEDHEPIVDQSISLSSSEQNQDEPTELSPVEKGNSIFTVPAESEPDLLQHDVQSNPIVLHSVDSIVNATSLVDAQVNYYCQYYQGQ